jgi:hypothetical protein
MMRYRSPRGRCMMVNLLDTFLFIFPTVLILSIFYFLSSTMDLTQGLVLGRQELYHLRYSANPLSNYLYHITYIFADRQPVLILSNIYSPCTVARMIFFLDRKLFFLEHGNSNIILTLPRVLLMVVGAVLVNVYNL